MSVVTRLFNRVNGRIQDEKSNPEKERNIYSSVYSYRGENPRQKISEHMEANRNIDGSWHVARHRMTIDKDDVGSVGYIPGWDIDTIEAETDFDTARRLVREFEETHRGVGFEVSSFDGDDMDHVATVDARVKKARQKQLKMAA